MKNLILASNSVRRKKILEDIGLTFTVRAFETKEESAMEPGAGPEETVAAIAGLKAEAAFHGIQEDGVIIAADTVVYHNGAILGKPGNAQEAFQMLLALSGNRHAVYTAVRITEKKGGAVLRSVSFTERTLVQMRDITQEEIKQYIDTGEPFDKAGGYGIQGLGGVFVAWIEGDYFNVVGLPLCKTYQALMSFDAI